KILQQNRIVMRRGGNDAISFFSQSFHTTHAVLMLENIYPLLSSHSNLFVDSLAETLFDYVKLLNSKNFTASHHSASVVQLIDIFYGHRKVFRTVLQNFYKSLSSLWSNNGFEIF